MKRILLIVSAALSLQGISSERNLDGLGALFSVPELSWASELGNQDLPPDWQPDLLLMEVDPVSTKAPAQKAPAATCNTPNLSRGSAIKKRTQLKHVKIPKSRTPVFDAVIVCAVFESGARVIDAESGELEVTNYDRFVKCVSQKARKANQTSIEAVRIKTFKKFLPDWPDLEIAELGNFRVQIKKRPDDPLAANLTRFKKIYPAFLKLKGEANND